MCGSYVFLFSDGSSIVSSVWMTCDRSWLASLANPSSTCSVGYVGLIPVVKVQSTSRWVSSFQPCFWMLGDWCINQSYEKSSVQAFHRRTKYSVTSPMWKDESLGSWRRLSWKLRSWASLSVAEPLTLVKDVESRYWISFICTIVHIDDCCHNSSDLSPQ